MGLKKHMYWQRLDRDTSSKILSSVSSEEQVGLFSSATSEVTRAHLKFYIGYDLYKITNYASLPSFTFEYLSDGTFFHYLDGTEEPIYTVNAKGALSLDEHSALAYLTFFLEHVGGEEGEERILIADPHEMPLLDSLGPDALDSVMHAHRPPSCAYDGGLDAYIVTADLYMDGQLARATIEVKSSGKVRIAGQKTLLHGFSGTGAASELM